MVELITVDNDPKLILRKVSKPVGKLSPTVMTAVVALVDYLAGTAHEEVSTVSLSGPQVGKSIRIIAFILTHHSKREQPLRYLLTLR